ncbi:MAG: phosphatase PAP2 family protein [Verrucomicrobiota bacterium]
MKIVIFSLFLAIAPAFVQAKSSDHETLTSSQWISFDEFQKWQLMPDPPRPDSIIQQKDMYVMEWMQRTRTPEQVAEARKLEHLVWTNFRDLITSSITDQEAEAISTLFDSMAGEMAPVIYHFKDLFDRPRPYAVNLDLSPCVSLEHSMSYPSGHATWGYAAGMLLGDLFPSDQEALLERGKLVGYARVIGGVHYPTDVLSGERLGEAMAESIMKTDAWKAWKSKHGYPKNGK